MATQYHVYRNNGSGGAVDYSAIVATAATAAYNTAALTYPGDWTYAIRAYDTVSGLEEANTETRVRIVLDAAGLDITARPNAPIHLYATPGASGTALVEFAYNAALQGGPPTSFKVWKTAGGSVNYGVSPATTTTYTAGQFLYLVTITGLSDATDYAIGVRATNAAGDETNTTSVSVTGHTTGPSPVEVLAGSLTFVRGD